MSYTTTTSLPQPPWYVLPILCFTMPLMGVSIDLYVPSLPWIADSLHTTDRLAKFTLPIYLYGYALSPVLFGAWSDAMGRRQPLVIGMILYIIATIACAMSVNITELLFLRFLQGFSLAVMSISYRAIISDFYGPVNRIHSVMAVTATFWAIGPIIAPFIGGYLQAFFGWRASFVFLALYGVLAILCFWILPESHHQCTPLRQQYLIKRYIRIFSEPMFWGGVLAMGLTYGSMLAFSVVGPFIIQDVLHYSPIQFGHMALYLGIAFFIGSYAYTFLLRYFRVMNIVFIGGSLGLSASVVMFVLAELFPIDIWLVMAPMWVIFFFMACAGLFQAAGGICISLFPDIAGTAGAATAVAYMLLVGLLGFMASFLKASTVVPLSIAYMVLLMLILLTYIFILRHHFKR
jgi:Bcr/CflA subfamily drug resistance transporter